MKGFWLLFFSAVHLVSALQKITTTRCCSTSYSLLYASCEEKFDYDDEYGNDFEVNSNHSNGSVTDKHGLEEPAWSIPVYSRQNNRTKTADFHFNYDLIQCPDGYVVKHALDFKLYNDGSLVTNWGSFPSGTFCLDQFVTTRDPEFVARFCVPDPCRNGYCMRKCCPLGMVINFNTRECEIHSKELNFTIQNENGFVVNSTNISIIDGATSPVCKNSINVLQPDLYGETDEFYILPSGLLKIPGYDKDKSIEADYCVEHFLDENITVC